MHRLIWFVVQAARSVRASPVVQLVAVSTIAVALLVPGAVGVLLVNLDHVVDRWRVDVDLVAFPDVPDDALPGLVARIEALPRVLSTRGLDRDAALADLRTAFPDDAPLLEGIDRSLLPAVIEVRLEPEDRTPEGRAAVAGLLSAMPGLSTVDAVDDGADLIARLEQVRTAARAGGLVMAILAVLSVIFVISNTIRLTLFARRDELEIMQLVGATDGFIRAPCYLEGAFQGVAGAALAIVGLLLLVEAVPPEALSGLLDDTHELAFLPMGLLVTGVLGAALVGVLASHLATGRYLRRDDV